MQTPSYFSILTILALAVQASVVSAVPAKVGSVQGLAPQSFQILSVSGGLAESGKGKFKLKSSTGQSRLYLLDQAGSLAGAVIAAVSAPNSKGKTVYYSYAKALSKQICSNPAARLIMGVNVGTAKVNLGKVLVKAEEGVGYLAKLPPKARLDKSSLTAIADTEKCTPAGTGANLGLGQPVSAGLVYAVVARSLPTPTGNNAPIADDQDGDGLLDVLDIDKNNDGVINAYDLEVSPPTPGVIPSFKIFSNLKLDLARSLNQYVQTLSDADLDTAVGELGLAIEVAGSAGETVELDCNGLSYCSSGGTGQYDNQPFPANFDTDSDGLGEMEKGPTGDFQLRPMVTSRSAIGGGDTFIEVVTAADGSVSKVPGMLNFVFNTTPAISSMTMNGITYSPAYPAHPGDPSAFGMEGSDSSPFVAPAGWDGLLTISAYRPQRPGINGAGEGAFVDVGKSLITIDIPNQPCSASTPGCGGQGPGNCVVSSYSEDDAELEIGADGLRDLRSDQDTDSADPEGNRVTFSVDLNACLANAHPDPIAWNAGEKLGIDLQFRNNYGDNAAQKFYLQKP